MFFFEENNGDTSWRNENNQAKNGEKLTIWSDIRSRNLPKNWILDDFGQKLWQKLDLGRFWPKMWLKVVRWLKVICKSPILRSWLGFSMQKARFFVKRLI
jgi:hypothetical protein